MDSNNWKKYKWGEISELKYGKALKGYKEKLSGVRVFGTNGPIGFTEEPLADGPSVIIGRKGAYRGVHYTDAPFYVIDTAFYLVPKIKMNMKWVYYELLLKDINSMDSGSAIPSTSKEDFYSLESGIPPLKVQNNIVAFLDLFESKIENNLSVIRNLEELSSSLFKRWFIDFEFPNEQGLPYRSSGGEMIESELGKIPKNWTVKSLSEITDKFTTGLNPRKNFVLGQGRNFYVTIKNMGNNIIVLNEKCDKIDDEALKIINKRSDLKKGDVLFSGIGTIGRVYLIQKEPKNWNISESIFTLRHNSTISSEYLYQLMLSENIQKYSLSLASGSVQKGIRKTDLLNYKLAISNNSIENQFSLLIKPWIESVHNLNEENLKLRNLRDILLPKFLSGEIEIPGESVVEPS
ncbi:MAG: restriction endonuclease subunit S [Solibacillus sp.]